jgi:hypothetical protein
LDITPQVLLEGQMDLMSTAEDTAEQRRRLVRANVTEIVLQSYGHMVGFWGVVIVLCTRCHRADAYK